ncbi:serine/threonine protein phosphatase [Streptodolium elevatio]
MKHTRHDDRHDSSDPTPRPWSLHGAATLGLGPTAPGGPPTPRSVPRPAPRHAWGRAQGQVQAVSVWTEQVPGRGEDAEPLVAHHWRSAQGLLAVFDGSGGAGAAPTWQAPDGTSRTGAWVGARTARLATDCWFHDVTRELQDPEPQSLHEYLRYFLENAPQRRSKIGGTMRRQLPTTLAGLHYRLPEGRREVELRALWAGDSRVYALLPGSGLHVLTRDHTRESDALELLRSDPPMTNLVCADRDFEIDSHQISLPLPCVLVAATDGFFGYVHTPSDFEHLLLRTLQQADNAAHWADLIRHEVESFTADDSSLALLALSFRDFDYLRTEFSDRFLKLHDQQVSRPAVLTAAQTTVADPYQTAAEVRAWQDWSWHKYRGSYESCLPPLPEEPA